MIIKSTCLRCGDRIAELKFSDDAAAKYCSEKCESAAPVKLDPIAFVSHYSLISLTIIIIASSLRSFADIFSGEGLLLWAPITLTAGITLGLEPLLVCTIAVYLKVQQLMLFVKLSEKIGRLASVILHIAVLAGTFFVGSNLPMYFER